MNYFCFVIVYNLAARHIKAYNSRIFKTSCVCQFKFYIHRLHALQQHSPIRHHLTSSYVSQPSRGMSALALQQHSPIRHHLTSSYVSQPSRGMSALALQQPSPIRHHLTSSYVSQPSRGMSALAGMRTWVSPASPRASNPPPTQCVE